MRPGLLGALERATSGGTEGRRRSGWVVMLLSAVCIYGLMRHGAVQREESRAVWAGGACLVDLENDHTPDIAGLLSVGTRGRRAPVLLDGRTGEIYWRGRSSSDLEAIFCPAPLLLGLVTSRPSLHLRAASNPALGWEVELSSQPTSVGVGTECITLANEERHRVGLLLEDGTPTPCPAPASEALQEKPRLGTGGGLRLTVEEGPSGVLLRAEEGSVLLWQTSLSDRPTQLGQAEDLVWVMTPGTVSALERESGRTVWTFQSSP